MVDTETDALTTKVSEDAPTDNRDLERALHAAIKRVTQAVSDLRFNTAISHLMVFVNEATKAPAIPRAWVRGVVKILSPFRTARRRGLWQRLGQTRTRSRTKRCRARREQARDGHDKIRDQIGGKLRGRDRGRGADATQERFSRRQGLTRRCSPSSPAGDQEEIYVKGRLVNLVVDWACAGATRSVTARLACSSAHAHRCDDDRGTGASLVSMTGCRRVGFARSDAKPQPPVGRSASNTFVTVSVPMVSGTARSRCYRDGRTQAKRDCGAGERRRRAARVSLPFAEDEELVRAIDPAGDVEIAALARAQVQHEAPRSHREADSPTDVERDVRILEWERGDRGRGAGVVEIGDARSNGASPSRGFSTTRSFHRTPNDVEQRRVSGLRSSMKGSHRPESVDVEGRRRRRSCRAGRGRRSRPCHRRRCRGSGRRSSLTVVIDIVHAIAIEIRTGHIATTHQHHQDPDRTHRRQPITRLG